MCFVELKTLTKIVAAQVCRPHMLFLCLHAVCSPSKSFGTSMEKCFMSEKNYLLKCHLKKGVKHCNCEMRPRSNIISTHLSIHAERIPNVNVEKRILTFSRDVALYRFISRVIDLISSKSQTIKPCCEKIYYLHIN